MENRHVSLRTVRNIIVITIGSSFLTNCNWVCDKLCRPDTSLVSWRARLNNFAQSVTLDSSAEARSQALLDSAGGSSRNAVMTPAAARSANTLGRGQIVARIDSDSNYSALGLARGVNYLWADTVSVPARALVIPADTRYPIMWLALGGPQSDTTRLPRIHSSTVTACVRCKTSSNCPTSSTHSTFASVDTAILSTEK